MARISLCSAISAYPMLSSFAASQRARCHSAAESSSSSCGPPVRFQLLTTPPHDDAGTFNYRALAYPDTDFHRAVCAPSWAHWELACKRTNPKDLPERLLQPPTRDVYASTCLTNGMVNRRCAANDAESSRARADIRLGTSRATRRSK